MSRPGAVIPRCRARPRRRRWSGLNPPRSDHRPPTTGKARGTRTADGHRATDLHRRSAMNTLQDEYVGRHRLGVMPIDDEAAASARRKTESAARGLRLHNWPLHLAESERSAHVAECTP